MVRAQLSLVCPKDHVSAMRLTCIVHVIMTSLSLDLLFYFLYLCNCVTITVTMSSDVTDV